VITDLGIAYKFTSTLSANVMVNNYLMYIQIYGKTFVTLEAVALKRLRNPFKQAAPLAIFYFKAHTLVGVKGRPTLFAEAYGRWLKSMHADAARLARFAVGA
jgi:hypothetical protein